MSEQRTESVVDHRFGFPIVIVDAPIRSFHGEEFVDLDPNVLRLAVLASLVLKPGRLTGAEVRFVRQWREQSLREFAEELGVTHPAIVKWEGKKAEATGMAVGTELLLRQLIVEGLPWAVTSRLVVADGEEDGRSVIEGFARIRQRLRSDDAGAGPVRVEPEELERLRVA